ncbi:MAG: ABC transporter substrate-binding protein [Spirochaetaceae bacterium]|nr:ABC transporter substrate-binding protein [Spirochaetaceae bacterium]
MRKIVLTFGAAVLLAVFIPLVSLASCAKKSDKPIIGISKIVAHPALDAVEQGVQDEFVEAGLDVLFDLQNANGDVNTAAQIAAQFQNEKAVLAIGIATPVAVALASNLKGIPVVFAAVTDPVGAGLVDVLSNGKGNVTGMSDAIPVAAQIHMFKDIGNLKTLGYIYTSNESNSISALADVENACKSEGINLVAQAISTSSEVRQAVEAIAGRVDGIYITTDNTIYSALPSLIEVCHRVKKPLFSADVTSCKEGGAMIAQGFSYYKAGRATGKMAIQILNGASPEEIAVRFLTEPDEFDLLFDLDEAKNCGLVIPDKYLDMANFVIQNGVLTEIEN